MNDITKEPDKIDDQQTRTARESLLLPVSASAVKSAYGEKSDNNPEGLPSMAPAVAKKTSLDPEPQKEKPIFVGYFAPGNEIPLLLVHEDHSTLGYSRFRSELPNFDSLVIVPMRDLVIPVSDDIKAMLKLPEVVKTEDPAVELHKNTIRYDENMKLQDEVTREAVRKEIIEKAPPEEKEALQRAAGRASEAKPEPPKSSV